MSEDGLALRPGRVLCAVLASPPLTAGVRTRNMVNTAAGLLGCERVVVVNLLDVQTADIPAMSGAGSDEQAWRDSRPALTTGLLEADELLAAWGTQDLTGRARTHRRDQLAWLGAAAAACDHHTVWAVGAEPRHPSRWHQYVSDRHGRTAATGNTSERLAEVLTRLPLTCVTSRCPESRSQHRACGGRRLSDAHSDGECAPFVAVTH